MHSIDARDRLARLQPRAASALAALAILHACAAEPAAEVSGDPQALAAAGAAAPQAERARQKHWQAPVPVGTFSGDMRAPSLSVNARGDAILAWEQGARFGGNAASATYAAGSGWRAAVLLPTRVVTTPPSSTVREVYAALDDAGRGLLVWDEVENPASVFGRTAGWSDPDYGTPSELLHFDPTVATTYGPRFAANRDGRAIALWGYAAGRGVAIQAFRYAPDAGWGPETDLQWDPAPTGVQGIVEADVALGAQGVAFTTYAVQGVPWANRSTPDSPAGAAQRLAAADSGGAATPRVAADGSGNALAVWTRHLPGERQTLAARYQRDRGWSAAAILQSAPVTGDDPVGFAEVSQVRALFTADGQPCAAFLRPEPQHVDVWTSCYQGRRWSRPERIDVGEAGESRGLQVAADGVGSWVVVWSRADGTTERVYANRNAHGRWSGATQLDGGTSPVVALDAQGNGFAAFTQLRGYQRVLVSRLE